MTKRPSSDSACDIVLDKFAFRQFESVGYAGTKIPLSKDELMQRVLDYYHERKAVADEFHDRPVLIDGYAPFCKHMFMPNFDERIVDAAVRIDAANHHLLRTKYEARKDGELPVLSRSFPAGSVQPVVAQYLDLIRKYYASLIFSCFCSARFQICFALCCGHSDVEWITLVTLSVQPRAGGERARGNGRGKQRAAGGSAVASYWHQGTIRGT